MTRPERNSQLVGNRIMLSGVVLYLLEWVAILGTGSTDPSKLTAVLGRPAPDIVVAYEGREDALAFMAGWFSVVLLGRVLLVVGLKHSLVVSGRPHPLMDFAVAAMTVSVALEVAAYGLVAAAALLGAGQPEGIVAVEWSAGSVARMAGAAVGVSLLACGWAMWRSGLFPRALTILAIIPGAALAIMAMFLTAPTFETVTGILGFSVYLFFIWMVWAGILLWIRTPRRAGSTAVAEAPASDH